MIWSGWSYQTMFGLAERNSRFEVEEVVWQTLALLVTGWNMSSDMERHKKSILP